jgi:hypothetical protein
VTRTLRECSAWLRLGALSLALFAAVGVAQILPALHFALVVHRVCAEHGELLHESAPVARQVAPAETSSVVARDGVSHEHEHCGVLAASESSAALVPAASHVTAPSAAGASVGLGRARAAHVRIALLAYAPKLAPPGALG